MMLNFILKKTFSKSSLKVLLIRNFPALGYEGELVDVKPGYAYRYLIPQKYAVYNFPGTREKLFPNISDELIANQKKFDKTISSFQQIIQKIQISLIKPPMFAQPTNLKIEIEAKEIVREVQNKYNIQNLKLEMLNLSSPINKFGIYYIDVNNYYNDQIKNHFKFTITVQVNKLEIDQDPLNIQKTGSSQLSLIPIGQTAADINNQTKNQIPNKNEQKIGKKKTIQKLLEKENTDNTKKKKK